ncbi:uncharacterized protein KGF55_001862 [Candida pseudojiufengensis]|uniref:uncharacterized protein n=1 Tax=Candida pseudojiufengensis TaxID=497109 RepID=UPI0022248116|nr:uncharacterized protein KGF55_001862 [Candida pseudojiufengensis]KAI5964792.1 hypothetical protein KGF55_001862 [Candida pseudojiufengensis]
MSKENQELNEILSEFQDSSPEIQAKRQQLISNIEKNTYLNEYPNQLSIMTSLDELIGCFALGGQFKHYYRYGTYDNCQLQRSKFWFAIKHGTLVESSKNETKPLEKLNDKELENRAKIQEFFKKRLMNDKLKGSSEDIWDARNKLQEYPFETK